MWRQIAKIELTKDGTPGATSQGSACLTSGRASDARTILVNQQATRRARVMFSEGKQISDTVTATNQGVTDQLLRELLKRLESIDEQAKKANAQKMGVVGPPAPPAHRAPGRRRRQARILMDNSNISQIVRFLDAFVASLNFLRLGIDQTLGRDVATRIIEQINERRGGRTARHGRIVEWERAENTRREKQSGTSWTCTSQMIERARCSAKGLSLAARRSSRKRSR